MWHPVPYFSVDTSVTLHDACVLRRRLGPFAVMSWNKMADLNSEDIVPREPSLAVFSRADFMKESFSVDSFVGSCKGSVPLDTLKTNLDDYLKALKHALIELINEDYADFVNLSTNLVGVSITELLLPHVKKMLTYGSVKLENLIFLLTWFHFNY